MNLIRWPRRLRWQSFTPRGGPVTLGVSTSQTDYVQTVSTPNGLVAFDLTFPPMRGVDARAFRGLVTDLEGGANAVRWTLCDPDRMGNATIGFALTAAIKSEGLTWSNGQPWSNGQNWHAAPPTARVHAAAAIDATTIQVDTTKWGGALDRGTMLGFSGHFGLYTVRSVTHSGSVATARIWPRLRRAIAPGQLVTLSPTLAVRLTGQTGGQWSRDLLLTGASLSLVEVPDYVIRRDAIAI